MNDYNRDTFWTNIDETTEEKRYFIKLNGKMVEVSKEVFYTMFNSYRKALYDNKLEAERKTVSLDATSENSAGLYAVLADADFKDEFYYSELKNVVKTQIQELDEIDKQILNLCLFQGMSEREIGRKLNIPQKTIHNHKVKSLKKIKKFLKSWLK